AVVIGLSCASMTGIDLPLASRMSELDHPTSSSAGGRIIVPAIQLVEKMSDPAYFFTGTGAGSTTTEQGLPWPIVKIINEYGFLAMVSFVVFYVVVLRSNPYDVPLKIAISCLFHFTGGYLVDPGAVYFLVLLCMCQSPIRRIVPLLLSQRVTI